jgi:deazaflavin-dependent oxidoreductase (nitroreductase family)
MQKSAMKHNLNTVLTQMFWGVKQWLYHEKRPNWIAKILNGSIANSASKSVSPDGVVALEVIGRKSGRVISFPLVVAVVDGQRYIASMLGEDAQWVRNVRAAGGKAVLRSGGYEDIQLKEIPSNQRAPLLKAYLQAAPGARPHMPVDVDAPLAEFEKIAAEYPVFRVVSNQKN